MTSRSEMIESLRSVAQRVLPEGSQVWLYGSRARGDNRNDSDWDLLILVDMPRAGSTDEDNYSYPFVLTGWQHSAAVSPLLYTFEDWNRRRATPFYENIENDKIQIA